MTRQIAIWFDTDKHGKRIAYRWSPMQFRSFRVGIAEAELLIATEQAVRIDLSFATLFGYRKSAR